jgi:hypothetical protein
VELQFLRRGNQERSPFHPQSEGLNHDLALVFRAYLEREQAGLPWNALEIPGGGQAEALGQSACGDTHRDAVLRTSPAAKDGDGIRGIRAVNHGCRQAGGEDLEEREKKEHAGDTHRQ